MFLKTIFLLILLGHAYVIYSSRAQNRPKYLYVLTSDPAKSAALEQKVEEVPVIVEQGPIESYPVKELPPVAVVTPTPDFGTLQWRNELNARIAEYETEKETEKRAWMKWFKTGPKISKDHNSSISKPSEYYLGNYAQRYQKSSPKPEIENPSVKEWDPPSTESITIVAHIEEIPPDSPRYVHPETTTEQPSIENILLTREPGRIIEITPYPQTFIQTERTTQHSSYPDVIESREPIRIAEATPTQETFRYTEGIQHSNQPNIQLLSEPTKVVQDTSSIEIVKSSKPGGPSAILVNQQIPNIELYVKSRKIVQITPPPKSISSITEGRRKSEQPSFIFVDQNNRVLSSSNTEIKTVSSTTEGHRKPEQPNVILVKQNSEILSSSTTVKPVSSTTEGRRKPEVQNVIFVNQNNKVVSSSTTEKPILITSTHATEPTPVKNPISESTVVVTPRAQDKAESLEPAASSGWMSYLGLGSLYGAGVGTVYGSGQGSTYGSGWRNGQGGVNANGGVGVRPGSGWRNSGLGWKSPGGGYGWRGSKYS